MQAKNVPLYNKRLQGSSKNWGIKRWLQAEEERSWLNTKTTKCWRHRNVERLFQQQNRKFVWQRRKGKCKINELCFFVGGKYAFKACMKGNVKMRHATLSFLAKVIDEGRIWDTSDLVRSSTLYPHLFAIRSPICESSILRVHRFILHPLAYLPSL